jgi:hypothetical protein
MSSVEFVYEDGTTINVPMFKSFVGIDKNEKPITAKVKSKITKELENRIKEVLSLEGKILIG